MWFNIYMTTNGNLHQETVQEKYARQAEAAKVPHLFVSAHIEYGRLCAACGKAGNAKCHKMPLFGGPWPQS